MTGRRTKRLAAALQAQSDAHSDEKRMAKLKKKQPWRYLLRRWDDEVRDLFGEGVELPKWGGVQQRLLRDLLKELSRDVDEAEARITKFIHWWHGNRQGLPSFRFFWAVRTKVDNLSAAARALDEKQLAEREWDPNAEHDENDESGWGGIFK